MIRQNTSAGQSITSKSAEETQKIAERLAKQHILKRYAGNLICLYGELGSGKTTFVKGFANGLKIKSRIQSPTFTYSRVHRGIRKLYHFDCYRARTEFLIKVAPFGRINSLSSAPAEPDASRSRRALAGLASLRLGLMEILEALEYKDGIVIIEWPQYIVNYLPKKRIDIYLDHINPHTRNIKIIRR